MTSEQIHIGNMSHETAIGILKLMLEAMETYDGISPTPARINAIKMAIEALEQEPKPMVEIDLDYVIKQKYIEREVLDNIRSEIETKYGQCSICEYDSDYDGRWYQVGDIADILQMIDNCKAETEVDNGNNNNRRRSYSRVGTCAAGSIKGNRNVTISD